MVAKNLIGLGGRFRLFKLGGLIGSCRSNLYCIVGSFESEPIVTICGPGDAMDDIVVFFQVLVPDISVELRTIGVFGLGGLGSLDDYST